MSLVHFLLWIHITSTVKKNEQYPQPTNPNWCLIVVGTKLQLKSLYFLKSKNVMVEPMCELLHHWGKAGKNISKLQMGNAREKNGDQTSMCILEKPCCGGVYC